MYYGNTLKIKDMPVDLRERAKIVQACVEEIKAQINADYDDADWSTMEAFLKEPTEPLNPFNTIIDENGEIHPYWTVGVKVKPYERRHTERDLPDHPEEP